MPIKAVLQGRVPIKIWSDIETVESAALDQLKNISSLPFVFKHVAAMPDVHLGVGATVGSVVATKGAVCPAAVGVDIGCGMVAAKLTGVKSSALDGKLSLIRSSIERTVPVGFSANEKVGRDVTDWKRWEDWDTLHKDVNDLKSRALSQMGSLGGGNHFIEVCVDTDDNVWVMLHSGSRNIGKSLAEAYITEAKGLMKKMFISLPDADLAYFAKESQEYAKYMHDLTWAQDYAAKNRDIMMRRVLREVGYHLGILQQKDVRDLPVEVDVLVNCHHNFAAQENHYGENVLVTRKGAVRAREGDMGIIPGSMGTKSYIVRGLGNADSFHSCSHGAGRRMSRGAAKKTFTLEDLAEQTKGVECRKDEAVLDEIPGAYKDIDTVMANQSDLVEVISVLKQVMCIKG